MKNNRIIFMGTPSISALYLQKLIDNKYNIVAVYTQPPRKKNRGLNIQKSPVHELSLKNNIPIYCPISLDSLDEIKNFKKIKSSLVIVMGYGIIFPKNILNFPEYGFINIHVSLLPRWRGAAPIEHAIINGDTKTGVSIFKLEKTLDTGPIIASVETNIEKNMTKEILIEKLNIVGTELLIKVLPDLFANKIKMHFQDENSSTYAKKITTKFRKINFNQDVYKVYNHIRAFSPKPSAWFIFKNERINICKCSMQVCKSKVSYIMNNDFHIGCIGGKIIPEIIQREGKKPMEINLFLRGFVFSIDDKINE